MRVTCGACWASLKVEARLANSVAHCPKCHERIRIPPRNSPDGANAVVVTEDDGLIEQAQAATPTRTAVAASPTSSRPPGPKTEQLPATLKRSARSATEQSAVHEEPARHKTKPLPKPVGRPSPLVGLPPWPAGAGQRQTERTVESFADEEQDTDAHDAGGSRKTMFTPLVPVAFVLGLIVGGAFGWFVGKPAGNVGNGHAVITPPEPQSAVTENIVLPERPTPTVTTPPATPPLPFRRVGWAATQPAGAAVEMIAASLSSIRVGGVMDTTPTASRLYWPAPPGQVYVELKATLRWTGRKPEPATIRLGGRDADIWLITRDGRVFNCLGSPRDAGPSETANSPADPAAKVTLDAEHPPAEVTLLFLTPARLPQARLQIAGMAFADLADEIREPAPVASGRSLVGRWEPVPEQSPLGWLPSLAIQEAFARGERNRQLLIERDGDHFRVQVEGTAIEGELAQRGDEPNLFDVTFRSAGGEQVVATLRIFDGSRKLLLYFGDGPQRHVAYRRGK